MKITNQISTLCIAAGLVVTTVNGFAPPHQAAVLETKLKMGLFDNFKTGGSGRDRLDEEWEKQQEILAARRAPKDQRDNYFKKIEQRREAASKEREEKWGWQTKSYGKGEDPLDEWKKRRKDGSISDLNDQYGDPKKIGGIPLPMASFGVGGEFGVGGKVRD